MARIDKNTIDRILDATDIVDVVSDFVSLKKRGSSYLGLCPFHNERTPSFSVSRSRGIFKCFSCGKAGTAVTFLTDLENMSYVEAIKWLGKKYGIEVKEREQTSAEKVAEATRESMFAANEFALKHFESTLTTTEDGRNIGLSYFRERGINDAMIAKFHLGYALERSDDFYSKARAAGFEEKYLIDTGLCILTERGTIYDRFKGRVIYPVHSLSGRVVAFGGRTLRKEKTVAKYVNSPESIIYSKSNELYGMYQARNAIAKKKKCILVEGYMDVISMHQVGVENVVASSGTSLTEGQIRMIKRFADKVTLIYDSDPAGIKASLRGIDMLIAAGLSLKIVLLPPGDDPDSFAQNHTSTEVEDYIATHEQDLIGFKVDVLMHDAAADPRARTSAINDILTTISIIPDVVEQSLYIDECARKVGVNANILATQLKKIIAKRREEEYRRRQANEATESIADLEQPQAEQPAEAEAITAQPDVASSNAAAATAAEPAKPISLSLRNAEQELITYVLRYGMLYMCDIYPNPEAENPVPMGVVDFIDSELRNDDINFRVPEFAKIWQLALDIRDNQWPAAIEEKRAELQQVRNDSLAAEQARIAQAGLGSDEIINLERKAQEQVDAEYEKSVDDYSARFINNALCRLSDRSVTDLVARLSSDHVVLSKMHPHVDRRAEVCAKLPLAINTLRNVLVKEQLFEQLERLKTVANDPVASQDCMDKIMKLKQISMELDKFNGEIVITPDQH